MAAVKADSDLRVMALKPAPEASSEWGFNRMGVREGARGTHSRSAAPRSNELVPLVLPSTSETPLSLLTRQQELANSGPGLMPSPPPQPPTRSPRRAAPLTRRAALRDKEVHNYQMMSAQSPQFDVQYYQMISAKNPQLVVPRPLSGSGGPTVVQVPTQLRHEPTSSIELPLTPPNGAIGRTIDGHLVGPDGNRWHPEGADGEGGGGGRSARRVAVPGWFKQEATNNGSIYAAETSYTTLNLLPGLPSCFSRATANAGATSPRSPAGTKEEEHSGGRVIKLRPEEDTKLVLTFCPTVCLPRALILLVYMSGLALARSIPLTRRLLSSHSSQYS